MLAPSEHWSRRWQQAGPGPNEQHRVECWNENGSAVVPPCSPAASSAGKAPVCSDEFPPADEAQHRKGSLSLQTLVIPIITQQYLAPSKLNCPWLMLRTHICYFFINICQARPTFIDIKAYLQHLHSIRSDICTFFEFAYS